ncbi:hypothetical protein Patl1_26125 [Pistacia atlantica]|uniref:Uncharacterized protein n=1 Tax=Pistacia atlantica TaxID=434234 RepID=A0ACC1B1S4_9ROSI|nr:hypothetical protein Patl1_26125 [Pistacia atlantica]
MDVVVHGSQTINEKVIVELVAAGHNHVAAILVSLLIELVEQEGHKHDIVVVVNFMEKAIDIFPATSDQLCLHGIGNAIRALYYKSDHYSPQTFMAISLVTFNILRSVHPKVLSDNEAWVAVTIKLIDCLVSTVVVHGWTHENLIVIGILSLILHHYTNNALVEASKTIVLNTSLVSTINSTIDTAFSKGPALTDYDEGANIGESLIFVLLLYYFYLRSLHAALPGPVEWQNFVGPLNSQQSLTAVSIHCHDLCRPMHFGSPSVKLVSSYCLLELFTRLSYQKSREHKELNCSTGFLMSIMAVLEGLVFFSDIRVVMNCGLCVSMVLGWENLDLQEKRMIAKNYWYRLIVEEIALSLAAPCLASKSFFNHHKPAVHVAVALPKLDNIPLWLRTVFDDSFISGIIGNLGARKVNSDMVLLFRELLISDFFKADQIASLNHVLRIKRKIMSFSFHLILLACRKYMYSNSTQEDSWDEHAEKKFTAVHDLREVRVYLIHLMSSQLSMKSENGDMRLLEELETFFRS